MKTLHTKVIHFKITNNTAITYIMKEEGVLFVEAHISHELSNSKKSIFWGYYNMRWSSVFCTNDTNIIKDSLRSKILDILSKTLYSESDAFSLTENIIYDFSNIENKSIGEICKKCTSD